MNPALYDHDVIQLQLIETHISWVILTGDYVYKIKKPVNLGFLDFSTLAKRRLYCHEELRLNTRLAPAIYLNVVEITGTPSRPSLNGSGDIIEYAVKMRQFPQQAQLDRMLKRGELQLNKIDAIAHMIATFHDRIEIADMDSPYGGPRQVFQPVIENFTQLHEHGITEKYQPQIEFLQQWSESAYAALKPVLSQRKSDGFIRECHGDMHLRNLAWYNGAPLAFDCLEFNPALRWIDVISEVAFLVMDLHDHQQAQLAHRFLNAYLEERGDYAGVQVLQFYLVYRAMVRAKVDAIRAGQPGISDSERDEAEQDCHGYLRLATHYTRVPNPVLIITRGLSASGKTTETQPLLELLGAIRIRSDVERKRLCGIKAQQSAEAETGKGIYSSEITSKTYARLCDMAGLVLDAGYPVIIDAANLKHEQRQFFENLATKKQIPYLILEFTAEADTLRKRIMERKHDASDANLKVLEHQLEDWQPISENEQVYTISINTEQPYDVLALREKIDAMAEAQSIR